MIIVGVICGVICMIGMILLVHKLRHYISCNYKITNTGIKILLFNLIPIKTIHFSNIKEIQKMPFREIFLHPLKILFFSRTHACGNRLFGKDIVLIYQKKGLFKRILITPDNPDSFVSEALQHISDKITYSYFTTKEINSVLIRICLLICIYLIFFLFYYSHIPIDVIGRVLLSFIVGISMFFFLQEITDFLFSKKIGLKISNKRFSIKRIIFGVFIYGGIMGIVFFLWSGLSRSF